MNTIESSKILAVLSAAYPRNICDDDAAALVRLWASVFSDVPYSDVGAAVMEFIKQDTKGFMPVPGQILEIVQGFETRKFGQLVERQFLNILSQSSGELKGGEVSHG